jgi:hypothetical protein
MILLRSMRSVCVSVPCRRGRVSKMPVLALPGREASAAGIPGARAANLGRMRRKT